MAALELNAAAARIHASSRPQPLPPPPAAAARLQPRPDPATVAGRWQQVKEATVFSAANGRLPAPGSAGIALPPPPPSLHAHHSGMTGGASNHTHHALSNLGSSSSSASTSAAAASGHLHTGQLPAPSSPSGPSGRAGAAQVPFHGAPQPQSPKFSVPITTQELALGRNQAAAGPSSSASASASAAASGSGVGLAAMVHSGSSIRLNTDWMSKKDADTPAAAPDDWRTTEVAGSGVTVLRAPSAGPGSIPPPPVAAVAVRRASVQEASILPLAAAAKGVGVEVGSARGPVADFWGELRSVSGTGGVQTHVGDTGGVPAAGGGGAAELPSAAAAAAVAAATTAAAAEGMARRWSSGGTLHQPS